MECALYSGAELHSHSKRSVVFCIHDLIRRKMLSTTTTTLPSSSDLSFFSSSKVSNAVASSSSSVVVKTRITYRPAPPSKQQSTPVLNPPPTLTISPTSSPLSSPQSHQKRKSPPQSALPREVKRLRASAFNSDRPRKRHSNVSSKRTSRGSSPEGELPPSPEPIYRSSRSRSTSLFPATEDEAPILNRSWITPEEGDPGSWHLSSEMVVKRLMRSYKACGYSSDLSSSPSSCSLLSLDFRNLEDPKDFSFKPHPKNYPVAELEYPNSGSLERYV